MKITIMLEKEQFIQINAVAVPGIVLHKDKKSFVFATEGDYAPYAEAVKGLVSLGMVKVVMGDDAKVEAPKAAAPKEEAEVEAPKEEVKVEAPVKKAQAKVKGE